LSESPEIIGFCGEVGFYLDIEFIGEAAIWDFRKPPSLFLGNWLYFGANLAYG